MIELNLKHYAYLGDCVWELMIREISIEKASKLKELHDITTQKANMNFQAEVLNEIQDLLTDEELDLVRRARNLSIPVGRKSNQAIYRQATALEALIGFWYKNDKLRLEEVFSIIRKN